MTIEFNCPKCDAIIAFDSKHIGKRARCLTCGQILIIPAENYAKPEVIKPKIEKGVPSPGFWRAVFIDNWKIFVDRENATALVFITAIVCFNFFLSAVPCCNYITFIIIWGWLLGFYLNIIYETAFGFDKLPEIYLGTSTTFLWYIVKPFLIFLATMIVVEIPFIFALKLLLPYGITVENMWQPGIGLHLILQILFLLGAFLFPIAILTAAVGKSIALLRPDRMLAPVFKVFIPYITIVALLVATYILGLYAKPFDDSSWLVISLRLLLNLSVQVASIITMRSIGLFFRHYNCHLKW